MPIFYLFIYIKSLLLLLRWLFSYFVMSLSAGTPSNYFTFHEDVLFLLLLGRSDNDFIDVIEVVEDSTMRVNFHLFFLFHGLQTE